MADRGGASDRQGGFARLGDGGGFGDGLLGVLVLFLDLAFGGFDLGLAVLVGAGGHSDGVGGLVGFLDLVNGILGGGDLLDVDVEQQLDGLLLDGLDHGVVHLVAFALVFDQRVALAHAA